MNSNPFEQLRASNKQQADRQGLFAVTEANKVGEGLKALLFSLAVFLFTFTSPIFLKNKDIPNNGKVLLLISWIFLVFSIVAGIVQTIKDLKFHDQSIAKNLKASKIWSATVQTQEEFNKKYDETEEIYGDRYLNKSNSTFFILQGTFVFIAFGMIVALAILLLFH